MHMLGPFSENEHQRLFPAFRETTGKSPYGPFSDRSFPFAGNYRDQHVARADRQDDK
jgi:hypothetical protein